MDCTRIILLDIICTQLVPKEFWFNFEHVAFLCLQQNNEISGRMLSFLLTDRIARFMFTEVRRMSLFIFLMKFISLQSYLLRTRLRVRYMCYSPCIELIYFHTNLTIQVNKHIKYVVLFTMFIFVYRCVKAVKEFSQK